MKRCKGKGPAIWQALGLFLSGQLEVVQNVLNFVAGQVCAVYADGGVSCEAVYPDIAVVHPNQKLIAVGGGVVVGGLIAAIDNIALGPMVGLRQVGNIYVNISASVLLRVEGSEKITYILTRLVRYDAGEVGIRDIDRTGS